MAKASRGGKDHSAATSSEKGTAAGFTRRSFLTSIELSKKIDGIAFWDNKTVKDVLFEAMNSYIVTWEKKNGPIKLPKNK